MLATASLSLTAGGWPPSTLATAAAVVAALGTSMHVYWHKCGAGRGGCGGGGVKVLYNSTHTFSTFPVSCVNFPHFSKGGKCKLLHKEVWESVANCVTVPTLSKVCVEKLNQNLPKKSRDNFSFPATPWDHNFGRFNHIKLPLGVGSITR
jgi:hypothetical protein